MSMHDPISPLRMSAHGDPLMSLDYGPSTSSPHIISSSSLSEFGGGGTFDDASPRFGKRVGTDIGTPYSLPASDSRLSWADRRRTTARTARAGAPQASAAWLGTLSDSGEAADALVSVQAQQQLVEAKAIASISSQRERRALREERRRRRCETDSVAITDIARDMEVEKSKIAQKAFESMMKATADQEDLRQEKWRLQQEEKRRVDEEQEELREAFHRRELERQREVNEEKNKFLEQLKRIETSRDAEVERERKALRDREKMDFQRFEDMQRRGIDEIQKLRKDMTSDMEQRERLHRAMEETRKLVEEKFDTMKNDALDQSSKESLQLTAELAASNQEKSSLTRQLDEVREELRRVVKSKEKDIDRAKEEAAAERRLRLSTEEKLEREKRDLENSLHAKQRECEMREWTLQQENEGEKRLRNTLEADLNRQLASLRRELDEKRETILSSSKLQNEQSIDLAKERDRLQHEVQALREAADAERSKAANQLLDLEKSLVALREKETAGQNIMELEKKRLDETARENTKLKQQVADLEKEKQTVGEALTQHKWELQKAKEEKTAMERSKAQLETELTEKTAVLQGKEKELKDKEIALQTTQVEVKNVEEKELTERETGKRRMAELQKALDDAQNKIKVITAEHEGDKLRLAEEKARAGKLQDASTRLETEVADLKVDNTAKEAEVAEHKAKIRQKDSEMARLIDIHKHEINDAKNDEKRAAGTKMTEATKKIADLSSEIVALKAELDGAKQSNDFEKSKQVSHLREQLDAVTDKERHAALEIEDLNRKLRVAENSLRSQKMETSAASQDVSLMGVETRETRFRMEIMDSEKGDVMNLNLMLLSGLHAAVRESERRWRGDLSRRQDELDRVKMELSREKEEGRYLEKDMQDLQKQARQEKEKVDQTADERLRQIKRELEKEREDRLEAEQKVRHLTRSLDDKGQDTQTSERKLVSLEKENRELLSEIDSLKTRLKAGGSAAAAPAPARRESTSAPAAVRGKDDPPQMIVLRARADLCEDKREALSIENSNGVYTLVEGGLSEVLKDPSNSRSSWPLAHCVWERKLPTPRWIYSSRKGCWKITDGIRAGGTFDLTAEIDEGSSFEHLVERRIPHDGAMPNAFKRWCRGVTCEAPPEEICVTADKSNSTGKYALVRGASGRPELVNGWPHWERRSGSKRWLYNTPDQSWQVGDSQRDFSRGSGLLVDVKHNGVLPHLLSWESGVSCSLFATGDEVRMRDRESDPWQLGTVQGAASNGKPLVRENGQSKAFQWLFVEKVASSASPSGDSSKVVAGLQTELDALKSKNDQNDKVIREQKDRIDEERARYERASRQLTEAEDKIADLERQLRRARESGGGGISSSSSTDVQVKLEREKRMDVERQMAQFKEAKDRNEKLLMEMFEDKAKLEARIKELEKYR